MNKKTKKIEADERDVKIYCAEHEQLCVYFNDFRRHISNIVKNL